MPTSRASARRRRRHRRGGGSRGFTLVELMISLVMGLIVSLAAIGLAKSATTAFHEQARMSGVEMTLRSASERFRSDLLKASYMSSPNIQLDTRIARTIAEKSASPWPAYRFTDLQDLQGIQIFNSSSTPAGAGKTRTEGTQTLATKNGLAPDDVLITGNLMSDDMYRAQWIGNSPCGGGGPQLRISSNADPAVLRMYNGNTVNADQVLATQGVFMPGLNMVPPVAGINYGVQVMDMRGCYHYLTICSVAPSPDPNSVLLNLNGDGTTGILTPDLTGDTCGGRLMEEFSIAPIHRVKWYLSSRDEGAGGVPDPRLYDPALEPAGANKFNLYRQLLAANGTTPVGPAEIVAEYAIDLKLGIVVDDLAAVPGTHTVQYYDMEGAEPQIAAWSNKATSTVALAAGPQRIRSVRYRMAFRAPYFDRSSDLPMTAGQPYLARYCVGPGTTGAGGTCKQWTRVRTVISEVALINQERVFF